MKRPYQSGWMQLGAIATLTWSASAAAQPMAPEPPPPLDPWYEALDFSLFADGYASVNTNFPKPQEDANRFRAYDQNNGMSLSWVGADVSHDPSPVGGTISLRLGPTAERYADSCLSSSTRCDGDVPGLTYVKQAFASWRPGGADGSVVFDFGKFDTIYGAEVAESQLNLNYTRGALYWLGQPLFHTGLRTTIDVWPELTVTALAVNGWNNTIDNNVGKTFGLQFGIRPAASFSAYLGWLAGPEQDDTIRCPNGTRYDPATDTCVGTGEPDPNAPGDVVDQGGANEFRAWRHLGDLVMLYTPLDELRLVLNADLGLEGVREFEYDGTTRIDQIMYYGGMLGARYALDATYAVAVRGEYFADPDGVQSGVDDLQLCTATLTLEAAPNDFLSLRLEGRGDFVLDGEEGDAGKDLFQKGVRERTAHMITTTLGVVVTTN
jgi:hypothetical protein